VIKNIQRILSDLLGEFGINAEICGREKSPYSIWKKMQKKRVSFEQLSDVMAFRILVDDIYDCYRALGAIHVKYHMVPGLFKDFISLPKKNGYRCLHTIIMGPGQKRIEIQIRTRDMHQVAEYGIAAHWVYKQNENYDAVSNNWLKELIGILNNSTDPNEFFENTKLAMYDDQVFCFTPKGNVVALPKGASAIDFAYAVHSDLGNSCVGVKINYKLAPLRSVLQNGDQVEIITNKGHKPLPSWEKFVVTGKALNEIRKSIREEKSQEYINLGRVLLAQLFEKKNIAMADNVVKELIAFYDKSSLDDLFYGIGEGRISQGNILKKISALTSRSDLPEKEIDILLPSHTKSPQVSIKGLIPGLAVHYAPCCSPIPGDHIIGLQQSKKGIVVHVSGCEILQNYSQVPETWLDLSWDRDSAKGMYSAVLKVVCLNKPGSLAVIAIEAAKYGCNVTNFRVMSRAADFFDLLVDLEVRGVSQLTQIIAALRSKDCIHSVERFSKD
jgi:GTP pyrophosphokinase